MGTFSNTNSGIYISSGTISTTNITTSGTFSVSSSTIYSSGLTFSNGYVTMANTIKLHILGEDYDFESYNYIGDNSLHSVIATLNVLGEPYWLELKKQGDFILDEDLEKFIEKRLKIKKRGDNLDTLVGNGDGEE